MSAAENGCTGKARLWTLASPLLVTLTLLACSACSSAHGNQWAEHLLLQPLSPT
jgi:hypothetical protein